METTIDGAGRIVVPKILRDALGLVPGTTLDVSAYGAGLALVPGGGRPGWSKKMAAWSWPPTGRSPMTICSL